MFTKFRRRIGWKTKAEKAAERAKVLAELQLNLTEARALQGEKDFTSDWRRVRKVNVMIRGLGSVYGITPEELGTTEAELDELVRPRSEELLETT